MSRLVCMFLQSRVAFHLFSESLFLVIIKIIIDKLPVKILLRDIQLRQIQILLCYLQVIDLQLSIDAYHFLVVSRICVWKRWNGTGSGFPWLPCRLCYRLYLALETNLFKSFVGSGFDDFYSFVLFNARRDFVDDLIDDCDAGRWDSLFVGLH